LTISDKYYVIWCNYFSRVKEHVNLQMQKRITGFQLLRLRNRRAGFNTSWGPIGRLSQYIALRNACAGLCKNREKIHFSFFQHTINKTTTIKLVRNPTEVQMQHLKLKFMQRGTNAS